MDLSYFELGEDNKKHILIIHGWAASKERFKPLARELVRRGWHVVGVDLPGFGSTPAPDLPLTLAGYTSTVRSWVRENLKVKSYVIFGHSFGGRVAARLAKSEKNIEGVVLCSPGVGTLDPLVRSFYRVVSKVLLFFSSVRRLLLRNYYSRMNGIVRTVMRGINYEDPKRTFSGIKFPTLILWGENDKIISVQHAEILKQWIQRSMVRTFSGIGHSLPYYRGANIAKEITTWSNTYISR